MFAKITKEVKKFFYWDPNPIIVKELRSRMRGGRAFIILSGALFLSGLFSYGIYRLVISLSYYGSMPLSAQVGQAIFVGLVFLQLLVICGITPAVTAGAISNEQQMLTYEMLLATPLNPARILWGKLVSSISFVVLILLAGIPFFSLVFVFGGVSIREMVKALIVLLTITLMIGVIGIFLSSLFKRTGRATVISYGTLLVLFVVPMVASFVYGIFKQTDPPRWMLIPNPITALMSAIQPSISPETPLAGQFWFLFNATWFSGRPQISMTTIPRPIYHYSLPFYIGIALLLYLVATRLVRPTNKWRVGWKKILVGLSLFVGYIGVVAFGFWISADRYEKIDVFGSPNTTEPMVFAREVSAVAIPEPAKPVLNSSYPVNIEPKVQAEIYYLVLTSILPPEISEVNLWIFTDDSVGDKNIFINSAGIELSTEIQYQLSSIIAGKNLGYSVNWVEKSEKDFLESGAAFVIFGNIQQQSDERFLVSASYETENIATGQTLIISYNNDEWVVEGNTGEIWER